MDDFGTGYSSLSYLRRFPLNQLKIDRSFVNEVTENADDAAIIAAIASLARTLKLEVVAEGVETAEQVRRLAEQGCRMMQGFYFSKPLAQNEIMPLLGRAAPYTAAPEKFMSEASHGEAASGGVPRIHQSGG